MILKWKGTQVDLIYTFMRRDIPTSYHITQLKLELTPQDILSYMKAFSMGIIFRQAYSAYSRAKSTYFSLIL